MDQIYFQKATLGVTFFDDRPPQKLKRLYIRYFLNPDWHLASHIGFSTKTIGNIRKTLPTVSSVRCAIRQSVTAMKYYDTLLLYNKFTTRQAVKRFFLNNLHIFSGITSAAVFELPNFK